MQGLILLDKPSGITSFSAVAKIKRICGTKRVGHTGTLDPMATGVLPVFVGRPTVLCSYLLESDKAYRATVKLGIATDTYDITGTVTAKNIISVDIEKLKITLDGFLGEQLQVPPMFSALKKDGVRLYDLARQGIEVQREARHINIKSIELINFEGDTFEIEVYCSKGTYIRSLANDIGEKLGCGASLAALRRIKTGCFTIDMCTPLDDIDSDNVEGFMKSEEQAVMHYPEINVTLKQAARFSNGGELGFERLHGNIIPGNTVRIKYNDTFVGLGFADGEKSAVTVICCTNFISL